LNVEIAIYSGSHRAQCFLIFKNTEIVDQLCFWPCLRSLGFSHPYFAFVDYSTAKGIVVHRVGKDKRRLQQKPLNLRSIYITATNTINSRESIMNLSLCKLAWEVSLLNSLNFLFLTLSTDVDAFSMRSR